MVFHSIRAALELVYSTSNIYHDFTYVAVAGAVFAAGAIVCYLIFYLLELCCLSRQRRRQAVHIPPPSSPLGNSREGWAWRPWQFKNNALLFSLKLAFVCAMGVVIWVAGGASGFNPWTAGATMMVIGIIITYMLAAPLGLWGAGFGVTGTNMINVGEYWEFYGMKDYDGWITGIYSLEVEMMRFDEKRNTEIISMPMTQFLNAPRKRNLVKELETDLPWKLVGDVHYREAPPPLPLPLKKKDSNKTLRKQIGNNFYLTPELLLV